jgi:hypothetical protein
MNADTMSNEEAVRVLSDVLDHYLAPGVLTAAALQRAHHALDTLSITTPPPMTAERAAAADVLAGIRRGFGMMATVEGAALDLAIATLRAPAGKPVAEVVEHESAGLKLQWVAGHPPAPAGTKLYTTPPVVSSPPSEAKRKVCDECNGHGYVVLDHELCDKCDGYGEAPSPAEQPKPATYEDFIRLATDPNRKPAERSVAPTPDGLGAREADPMTVRECRALLRELREDINPNDESDPHGVRLGLALDFAYDGVAKFAPLAAGRVGVAELAAKWERLAGEENMPLAAKETYRNCRADLLAGPLVAGEVEPVAWEAGRSRATATVLHQSERPNDPELKWLRPLVYADTAKAGES